MPVHDWSKVPAGTFHHFHLAWIAQLSKKLNRGVLPAGYYALAEQIAADTRLAPDVITLQEAIGPETNDVKGGDQGGTALAVEPPKVSVTAELAAEADFYAAKANRIAIRHVSSDRVVAVIEVVSPGNKGSQRSFDEFVEKAVDLLFEGIHLLVIDLQPPTSRDPQGIHSAIWQKLGGERFEPPPNKPLTLASYVAKPQTRAYVEPVGIGDRLIPMPLILSHQRYVDLPLEDSYMAAYEEVPPRARAPLDR
jgi:hypothetical protein